MTFFTIDNTQKINIILGANTDLGVAIDATPIPAWSVEDGNSDPVTLATAGDGFSAVNSSGTAPGDSVVLVQYSVGGVPQSAEYTVTVVAKPQIGNAVFTADAPVPK
jgi:hypothetical protein